VLKDIRGNDLIGGIRRVASGQSLLDPAVTARVLERVRRGTRRGGIGQRPVQASGRAEKDRAHLFGAQRDDQVHAGGIDQTLLDVSFG